MTSLASAAALYFANRLWDNDAWADLPETIQELAITTAEGDINTVLGTDNVDPDLMKDEAPFSFYQRAIFEWALFLATHKDEVARLRDKQASGITEVRVDGFGSEKYGASGQMPKDAYSDLIYRSPAGKLLRAIVDCRRILR